jgi:parvulin-like peptidyl-prolyl isomerase
VRLQAAVVPRRPIEADFTGAREKMQGIRDQIMAQPDSFPKYARTYSEAGSNSRGGDATDATYDQLRPSFQAALKPLEPGQVSGVVREERSVHLLRLDRRWMDEKTKQLKVHYHEIAFHVEPGAEAIRQARKGVQQLLADARKQGLAKAALRSGYSTTDTPFFREGRSNTDVFKRFPEMESWAFTAKVGSVSRPVPTENGWYVYEILERQPNGLRSLMTARVFVRERLIASLKLARATDAATQARAAMAAGATDLDVMKRFHGVQGIATDVTRNGYFGSLGPEPKMVGGLFSTPQGVWSKPLVGTSGVAVAFVLERLRPTEDDFRKQAPEIRNTLLNERRQALFTDWLTAIRKKAKIEDFRENYFEA